MTKALYVSMIHDEDKKRFSSLPADMTYIPASKVTQEDLSDTEIVFGNLPVDMLNSAPMLKWVQLDSAGADSYRTLKSEVKLTNASGAYGEAISEHMIGCLLAVAKNLYHYYDQQSEHVWSNIGTVPTLSTLKILSVGMGDIGSAFAKKMHMLGAHVSGIRRTVHEKPNYLDGLYTMDSLEELLPEFDAVALSLPSTPETEGLFNETLLHKMKKGAILMNVGRGSAIVENDLMKIMREEYLSAACIDVCEHEPLPKNSPLWNSRNVYITPHIAGKFNTAVTYQHILNMFETNLKHYLNDEPLDRTVDRKLGY